MDDVEKRLSDALHSLTPEPPTSYTFRPLDELGAVPPTVRHDRRRRPHLGPLLAAAAVVVLGAGIAVAAIGHGRPGTPPGAAPVPVCREDGLAVNPEEPVVGRGQVRVRIDIGNAGSATCRLRALPRFAVDPDLEHPTSPTRFRFLGVAMDHDLVLDSGEQLAIDLTLSAAGTCRTVSTLPGPGVGLVLDPRDGTVVTSPLGLVGCVLAPRSVSVRTVP